MDNVNATATTKPAEHAPNFDTMGLLQKFNKYETKVENAINSGIDYAGSALKSAWKNCEPTVLNFSPLYDGIGTSLMRKGAEGAVKGAADGAVKGAADGAAKGAVKEQHGAHAIGEAAAAAAAGAIVGAAGGKVIGEGVKAAGAAAAQGAIEAAKAAANMHAAMEAGKEAAAIAAGILMPGAGIAARAGKAVAEGVKKAAEAAEKK